MIHSMHTYALPHRGGDWHTWSRIDSLMCLIQIHVIIKHIVVLEIRVLVRRERERVLDLKGHGHILS